MSRDYRRDWLDEAAAAAAGVQVCSPAAGLRLGSGRVPCSGVVLVTGVVSHATPAARSGASSHFAAQITLVPPAA